MRLVGALNENNETFVPIIIIIIIIGGGGGGGGSSSSSSDGSSSSSGGGYCSSNCCFSPCMFDLHYSRTNSKATTLIHINLLNTKGRLLNLKTFKHFSSRYKNQSVYAVSGTSSSLFSRNTKHINTLWAERTVIEC